MKHTIATQGAGKITCVCGYECLFVKEIEIWVLLEHLEEHFGPLKFTIVPLEENPSPALEPK